MKYPQGFMRPRDERQAELIDQFGSLLDYLRQYVTRSLTEGSAPIQETIKQLNSQLDQEPILEVQSEYTETKQVIRSSAFRRRVYEIYEEKCAICGSKRVSPKGQPEIEAAHIYPKHRNGNDDIRNGLALCKLHHWAFDVGWLSVDDGYNLLVRDERRQGYEEFSRLAGQRIRLPNEKQLRPHSKFLRAHRAIHGFAE